MGRSGLGGEEATLDTTQAGVSEYLDNSVSMWTKWRDVAEQPWQNGGFVAVVKTYWPMYFVCRTFYFVLILTNIINSDLETQTMLIKSVKEMVTTEI